MIALAVFTSAIAIGVVVLALIGAYKVGRIASGQDLIQLRLTCKDLLARVRELRRQVTTVRHEVSRLRFDPRTHPHTQLELDKVLDVLTERDPDIRRVDSAGVDSDKLRRFEGGA